MTNNDCLRRIRYIFNYNDSTMMGIFAECDYKISREELSAFLKKDEDPGFKNCSDVILATFLNGLIVKKRGKKEGASDEPVKVEKSLNNNMIFMKLKIALNLKADEILELLELAEFRLSKHELSAFFRRADHKHYRKCKDQILRNFLKGLQLHYRQNAEVEDDKIEKSEPESVWGKARL